MRTVLWIEASFCQAVRWRAAAWSCFDGSSNTGRRPPSGAPYSGPFVPAINNNPAAVQGASALTTAELRLLPLLPTHLTLGEIGERLHVTRNTVKTQAIAIYRKFGVSSRRAAVSRMHELGLLPHD